MICPGYLNGLASHPQDRIDFPEFFAFCVDNQKSVLYYELTYKDKEVFCMDNTITGYDVGALLYSPANAHLDIVDALVQERLPQPFSLAFCLEDTVRDNAVEEAEKILSHTLERISAAEKERSFYRPLIFVRVRSPRQLLKLSEAFARFSNILTGFILPKFFSNNCDDYINGIRNGIDANLAWRYMPIFESALMIDLRTRYKQLAYVRDALDAVSDRILNIRVGGADLSQAFGLRRHVNNTIYDLQPVANLLSDIVSTFTQRYVVSGPVWEYYAGEGWDSGLRREIELDMLCGFIGKTVIHPNQIPVVNACMKVSAADYRDARQILGWAPHTSQLVCASTGANRMNEYKTHLRWADKILHLARKYGIRDVDASLS